MTMLNSNNVPRAKEAVGIIRKQAAEIARLQAAKRRALAVADERSKENAALRAENERLRAELEHTAGIEVAPLHAVT